VCLRSGSLGRKELILLAVLGCSILSSGAPVRADDDIWTESQSNNSECPEDNSTVTPMQIDFPDQYTAALRQSVSSCRGLVQVSSNLFGSLTHYSTLDPDRGRYLNGKGVNFSTGGTAIAWLSGMDTLQKIVSRDCCAVGSLPECFNNVVQDVEVLEKGQHAWNPPLQWVYIVTTAEFNNRTSFGAGECNLIQPTWHNLLTVYHETFDMVFRDVPGFNPECKVDSRVAAQLAQSVPGVLGWTSLFLENTAIFESLGCTIDAGCANATIYSFASQPVDAVCNHIAVVRAYLYRFLDANKWFKGTGRTDSGPEFITIPNRLMSTLPYVRSVLSFELSQSTPFMIH